MRTCTKCGKPANGFQSKYSSAALCVKHVMEQIKLSMKRGW